MEPVTGSVVIGFGDVFRARWHAAGKWIVAAVAIFITCYTWIDFANSALPRTPTTLLVGTFASIVTMLVFALLAICLLLLTAAIALRLFGPDARRIEYEFDGDGFRVRDARGMTLAVPWSAVKRVREIKSGFLVNANPRGLRFIPRRTFAAADVPRLRALLVSVLGARSRTWAP